MSSTIVAPLACRDGTYSYTHNPYDFERSRFVAYEPTIERNPLSAQTLHQLLDGHVTFLSYPSDAIEIAEPTADEQQYMTVKAFIGQLPFNVTQMQLTWICQLLGCRVVNPQRIVKNVGGVRQPTGGVHVFCDEATFESLWQNMHKRVLIDDTGVWFASNECEKRALDSYVQFLHQNKKMRVAGRPYDSVVVQRATSTFVPRRQVRFD